jgi:hypothetical protein
MTLLPPNVKVHLALGYVDMRKGIDGLAMLVRGVPRQDPFAGWLALPFSPMFWLPNTAITSLFAVKARSSPGKASSWIVRGPPTGWAEPCGGWNHCGPRLPRPVARRAMCRITTLQPK